MFNELVQRCRNGDTEAWEKLAASVYPRAMRRAGCLVRDPELAADAVQNAMLKLLRHLGTLREPDALPFWLDRVVGNEALLILRAGRNETPARIDEAERPLHAAPTADVAEAVAFRSEFFRAVRDLPLEYQDVVILADLQGLKTAEIAQRLGIPLGTVKSRLSRAREHLRTALLDFAVKRKGKKRMTATTIEEQLYDYLEGCLSPAEIARLEEKIKADPEIRAKLERQRAFLRVLHRVTGRKGLGLQGVIDKMEEVNAGLRDYRFEQRQITYTEDPPRVLTSTHYYKQPGKHRLEFSMPVVGEQVVVAGEEEMLTLYKSHNRAERLLLRKGALDAYLPSFPAMIRKLAESQTVTLLGAETVKGRDCYHLVFSREVPAVTAGELISHLWIDQGTWLPLVEELYDAESRLVQRTEMFDLHINEGLPDELFALEIPEGFELETKDLRGDRAAVPETVTLEEARKRVPFPLYTLPEDSPYVLQRVLTMELSGSTVVMLEYHQPGHPLPQVVVSQGEKYHGNIPPGMELEEVTVAGETGRYLHLSVPPVEGMVFYFRNGVHLAVGGNGTKEEIIGWAESLVQQE